MTRVGWLTTPPLSRTVTFMHGMIKTSASRTQQIFGEDLGPPIEIQRPLRLEGPVVFASPHSGRAYPPSFISASRLDPMTLRASEDAYVDELFHAAPRLGAPLVSARFPRAYLDANRDPWELDPAMFADPLPTRAKSRTPRVSAGLGCVPRIVADGAEIYDGLIRFEEAQHRIRELHQPYHRAVNSLLTEARAAFGAAVLIDCHSMPSGGEPSTSQTHSDKRIDMVIGDRHGASCAPAITDCLEGQLRSLGYRLARNTPYAGGWSTERYGRPGRGFNAVQIEINRGLYLDETTVSPHEGFETLRRDLTDVVGALIAFCAQWSRA